MKDSGVHNLVPMQGLFVVGAVKVRIITDKKKLPNRESCFARNW
jgi:hypothetical protein